MPQDFLPHNGGYRNLRVYKVTEMIYDMTYYFVHHFLEKGDRTIDQMEQAARSGKQNIVTSPTDTKGSIVLLMLLFLFPAIAQAQLQLGVRGGYNLTKLSLTTNDIKTNRDGFFIGPAVCFTLPVLGLGFDAAALYDQRDARIGDDPVTDIKQKSVNFPFHLRYDFAPDSPFSLFVFAGPQFSFNLNDEKKPIDSAREWRFKKSTMSVNLGAGAAFFRNFQLSVNYNIVCGETATINSVRDVSDSVKDHKAKTHAWQLALTVFF